MSTSTTPRQIALDRINEARETKKTLLEKLEKATGIKIFVINMLLDLNEIQDYTAQTRIQAEQSFEVSKYAMIIGYVLIISAIILGVIAMFVSTVTLDTAFLTAISGIITEFISGVFFAMYNKTITQVNLFHDKMMESKKEALSVLVNVLNKDPTKQNETYAKLAETLMAKKTGA